MKIQSNDQVEAQYGLSLAIDSSDNVTVTAQKVLVDETTGDTENDGDPKTITLASADALALIAALSPVLTPIVNNPNYGVTPPATTDTKTGS